MLVRLILRMRMSLGRVEQWVVVVVDGCGEAERVTNPHQTRVSFG